jgi:DNA polymerase III sliding clamp (beta) subunit (PCNA family)
MITLNSKHFGDLSNFQKYLESASVFMSKDVVIDNIACVRVELTQNEIKFVATDGAKLLIATTDNNYFNIDKSTVLHINKSMVKILKSMTSKDSVEHYIDTLNLIFSNEEKNKVHYPDYARVISEDEGIDFSDAKFNSSHLLDILQVFKKLGLTVNFKRIDNRKPAYIIGLSNEKIVARCFLMPMYY